MKLFISFLLILPVLGLSQVISVTNLDKTSGIRFEHGLTWKQVKLKAKEENKYIFVDCYTTWCGPCRYMAKNIFIQPNVGDFFNAHFINVAVQMDTTMADDASIKAQYLDAQMIRLKYSVTSFPTYLFFNADADPVHVFVGASRDQAEFISKAEDALDMNKQYYTILREWGKHSLDSAYLRTALMVLLSVKDSENIPALRDCYIMTLKNPLLPGNFGLIAQATLKTTDSSFGFLQNALLAKTMTEETCKLIRGSLGKVIYTEKVQPLFSLNKVVNFKTVENSLSRSFPQIADSTIKAYWKSRFRNDIIRAITNGIYDEGSDDADWAKIYLKYQGSFPGFSLSLIIAEQKPPYFEFKKRWVECSHSALSLLNRYGKKLDPEEINDVIWYDIFLHCGDRGVLLEGLKWSRYSLEHGFSAQSNCMDTYANLLYKMGNVKEALSWENNAIAALLLKHDHSLNPGDLADYKAHLDKMEHGEITWDIP